MHVGGLLFLGAKHFLELGKLGLEGGHGFGVDRLLALHGGDDDVVTEGELFVVGFHLCFVSGGLEALGEEIV